MHIFTKIIIFKRRSLRLSAIFYNGSRNGLKILRIFSQKKKINDSSPTFSRMCFAANVVCLKICGIEITILNQELFHYTVIFYILINGYTLSISLCVSE